MKQTMIMNFHTLIMGFAQGFHACNTFELVKAEKKSATSKENWDFYVWPFL